MKIITVINFYLVRNDNYILVEIYFEIMYLYSCLY
jgi:hypothetical protein